MESEHLLKLCRLAGPGWGVIPRNGDHLEPLCAVYPVSAMAMAEEILCGPRASVQDFGEKLKLCGLARFYNLTPAETGLYLNMNTPADVASEVPTKARS
jgi:molybdopterin-guanine dinucleotide biosynthesis protein A